MNACHRQNGLPDHNAEYLFYQTLTGAWPLPEDRAQSYMEKAAREAKQHTTWTRRNAPYEKALQNFISETLRDPEFTADVERFTGTLARAAAVNSLAQTLIKLTAPGVPDIYQGCELWDFSLVDPDNRRPVDFNLRRQLLAEMKNLSPGEIWNRRATGLPKLWLIQKTLKLRERFPDFSNLAYRPVYAKGSRSENVVGLIRGEQVLAVVPRFILKLNNDWQDTDSGIASRKLAQRTGRRRFWRSCPLGTIIPDISGRLAGPKGERLMHTFRVWATVPKKVEVQVAGKVFPMTAGDDGWWTADIPLTKADDEYGFILDGEGPFPDPRSPMQPQGVHKLSRPFDHGHFVWTDKKFNPPPLSSAVIYELHLGTFTRSGTFLSAIEKLDHLLALGVTHVELMPVVEFSGDHGWGYDGVDLFAPHHAYGSPDDLKTLVNACHSRGLAVILDVVYNHLGPSGNYLAKFAPYFTKKFASAWGEGINFDDPDSGEVRRFFCDNALMWLRDFHFDGLRLDAVHGIVDTSAIHFLEQLGREVVRWPRGLAVIWY